MHRYDVNVTWVDCDGDISLLIPLWLDVGVNCMFPIEVGTWGADPVELRKKYGKELLLMGGFDKRILAHSKEAIEAEIRRLTPSSRRAVTSDSATTGSRPTCRSTITGAISSGYGRSGDTGGI